MRLLPTLLSLCLLPCVMPDKAFAEQGVTMLYDSRFLLHDPGEYHPESAVRLKQIVTHLQWHADLSPYLRWPEFQPARREDLLRVHSADYLELLENEQARVRPGQHRSLSTGDTELSGQTLAVAKLASGAVMAGVDAVMRGETQTAFALVRPPGHHASRDRGMGFCVYNHVAVAARYAQYHYGIRRILIVDFDVHHGNGTQAIFYADPDVFYFSAHQSPLYPGTGRTQERGTGAGLGNTLNIEVPAGRDAGMILRALREPLTVAMQRFQPELILVSAGLDAHDGDTLGGLRYQDKDYAEIVQVLRKLAKNSAQGRMVLALEGGYVPANNAGAVAAILSVLVAD